MAESGSEGAGSEDAGAEAIRAGWRYDRRWSAQRPLMFRQKTLPRPMMLFIRRHSSGS